MEEELRKECARLQTVNAALQSEMILKHAPLEDLHAVRADKMAADAALARLGECVRGWAQRRGDTVSGELLAPSNPEQVSALFEYIKSGSRRHLAAACTPSHRRSDRKPAAVGEHSPWPSPAASPVIDDTHVTGLRKQLVELEVRLKTQATEHEQQLASAAAAKQALCKELAAKEKQLAEAAKIDIAAQNATVEQLQREKASVEQRADEMATKHTDAVSSAEKLQAQLRAAVSEHREAASTAAAAISSLQSKLESQEAKSAELSRCLGQTEQQKSELEEQREIMQRALESSQKHAEQTKRKAESLQEQLQQRQAAGEIMQRALESSQKHAEQTKRKAESLQEQLQQREAAGRQLNSRVEISERDRATLKSRLDTMTSTVVGLEKRLAEYQAARTSRSQQAAEDDSQTTQALNDGSQQTEASPAQVQLMSASSPGPKKTQPVDAENTRKRAAPDGTSQSNEHADCRSSRVHSDSVATRSPQTAHQRVAEASQCSKSEQTKCSAADASTAQPHESKKRRSTRDCPDNDELKPKVAMLSGFTSKEVLHGLEQQLEQMGVKIKRGNAFDKTITHVIAPAGQNTWKTIAGALAQRWVVHDGWVRDSYHAFLQQGKIPAEPSESNGQRPRQFFMDENRYGHKKETRIFNKKHFAFSEAFIAQHANKLMLMKSVTAFGGGKVLSATKGWETHASDERASTTHLFISDAEAAEKGHANTGGTVAAADEAGIASLTYDEFVHWIGVWRRSDTVAAKRAKTHAAQLSQRSGQVEVLHDRPPRSKA